MNVVSGLVDRLKAKLADNEAATEKFHKEYDPDYSISEEDEKTPAKNLRNTIVDKLKLPEGWKVSTADDKRFKQRAPEMMAAGTIGQARSIADKLVKKFPGAASVESKAAYEGVNSLNKLAQAKPYGGTAIVSSGAPKLGAVKVLDNAKQTILGRILTK